MIYLNLLQLGRAIATMRFDNNTQMKKTALWKKKRSEGGGGGGGGGASFFSWRRDRPSLVSANRDVLKNCSVNRDLSALRETRTEDQAK